MCEPITVLWIQKTFRLNVFFFFFQTRGGTLA